MVMRRCVKYRRDIHNLMGVGDDVFVWVSWAPENHIVQHPYNLINRPGT